jgi:hypothetical protein
MKFMGLCATVGLGLVGVSAIATTGCTSTTTVNNGDGGALFPDDAGDAAVDTGTAAPDTGLEDGATGCGVAPMTSNATCDVCLETMCCTALETCFGTSGSVTTMCENLVSCVQDAEAGNDAAAGMTMSDAFDLCAPDGGGNGYTTADVAAATAFLSCLGDGNPSGACATACPQQ